MEFVNTNKRTAIKDIFKDHWEDYLYKNINQVTNYQVNEVEKMLACRDPRKVGYHKYICPDHPDKYVIVPHSCKSRFCSVCGSLATDKWMTEAMRDFPDDGYFHVTLTIPNLLWAFFHEESHRLLLDILFKSANEAVLGWFRDNRKVVPAAIMVMHTFGKQINDNIHLHMIVSAGGIRKLNNKKNNKNIVFKSNDNNEEIYIWKKVNKLYWPALKTRWKAVFLKNINKYITDSLLQVISQPSWYVHVRGIIDNPIITVRYIGRYSKRPPIAETRIVNYDGSLVTFYYEDRDEQYGFKRKKFITLNAHEFIKRLIRHIPPPDFKMVRRYGILSNSQKNNLLPIAHFLLGETPKKLPLRQSSWETRQTEFLGHDPLICPKCGQHMILSEIAFWSQINDELYIKNMNLELELIIPTKGSLCPIGYF